MKRTEALNDRDIVEEFSRSAGPGGQNVNKVSTKVTLRHLPTNTTVTVQDSRSQARNRALARERLLEAIQAREQAVEAAERARKEKLRRRHSPRPPRLKARLLEAKRRRGETKKGRGRVGTSGWD